jgi:hypothetical protein
MRRQCLKACVQAAYITNNNALSTAIDRLHLLGYQYRHVRLSPVLQY